MSSNQPSLFGAYPWADGSVSAPTLWGSGYVPQTFSVSLSDSVTGTEADTVASTKILVDTLTLSEVRAMALNKVLADSMTPSDAVSKTVSKIFNETASVTDSSTVIFTIKEFSDFLVLKEWVSIKLQKRIIWTNPDVNANIFDTLYGAHLFGSKNVLWGGLKPLASWSRGSTSRRPSVWTNENGHKENY